MNLRVGLIVNPLAGVGGAVALRGSDDVAQQAMALGALPRAAARATEALLALRAIHGKVSLFTGAGALGMDAALAAGWSADIVYRGSSTTDAEDTRTLARRLSMMQVDLLLFAGGDGTARDIVDSVTEELPVLGIPAGVKMYSAVFATTPAAAGALALRFLSSTPGRTRSAEVMDLDENDLRRDRIAPVLYGYLASPEDPRLLQGGKMRSPPSDAVHAQAIAASVVEELQPGVAYLIGPGSTTWNVKRALGGAGTLLGVDVFVDRRLREADVTASALERIVAAQPARALVTCIGGQGHIFGRGNQQFSATVMRRIGRRGVSVLATPGKLGSLAGRPFLADLEDPLARAEMTGYVEVINGYRSKAFYRCEAF